VRTVESHRAHIRARSSALDPRRARALHASTIGIASTEQRLTRGFPRQGVTRPTTPPLACTAGGGRVAAKLRSGIRGVMSPEGEFRGDTGQASVTDPRPPPQGAERMTPDTPVRRGPSRPPDRPDRCPSPGMAGSSIAGHANAAAWNHRLPQRCLLPAGLRHRDVDDLRLGGSASSPRTGTANDRPAAPARQRTVVPLFPPGAFGAHRFQHRTASGRGTLEPSPTARPGAARCWGDWFPGALRRRTRARG
jgi:hypothetical protein